MKSGLFLDVVIRESAAIFKLLTGENETLLIRGDAFLILDLGFHVIDGVRGLDIKSNGLTRQGFYENLLYHKHVNSKNDTNGVRKIQLLKF